MIIFCFINNLHQSKIKLIKNQTANKVEQKNNQKIQNYTNKVTNIKIIMNKRQQQQFIYFFDELCEAEEVLDKLKIDLQNRPGFNVNLLFDLLSQGNQQIIISQFRRYLADRFPCSHRELYEIYEKFDSKRNGFITREDFAREITPFGQICRFNPQNRQGILNSQIQSSFLEIIIELLKRFRIIEEGRKQIILIQPWQAFEHLDYWRKGIIGLGDLKKLYQDNDFQIPEQSLKFLLHALRRRYHKDVTLQLFCETLNPLELGEYKNFAKQIQKQNQKEFLKRSRQQQEAVRRSRIDNQHLQYEIQRAERRKNAQIQRQLNLQQKINLEISEYEQNQQKIIRKAILEEERDIRNRSLLEKSLLQRDYLKSPQESMRLQQIQVLRQKQKFINENISRRIAEKQLALSASKNGTILERQIALQQEIQRQKQARRLLDISRQEQLSRSRRQYEADLLRQKQARLRELQKNRLLQNYQPLESSLTRSIKQSRIQNLQLELERTRAEMRERRERLERQEKLRLVQTASKSRVSAFPY